MMTVFVWVRQRMVQLLAAVESVIAVLVGFNHVDWSAEQTGLLMSLVAAVLSVVAHADQRSLRGALELHELAQFERDAWDRAALEELGGS